MAEKKAPTLLGIKLDNGTRVTHGEGANIKRPLSNAPVVMHELFAGADDDAHLSFEGQFGFIAFNTDCRLPRHIHMAEDEDGSLRMLPERILVLHGVGLTELCGEYYVVAPGTLLDIPPGVPHTWNACPAGVVLPDGTTSDGTFTMVYNYSESTNFYPTKQTEILENSSDYLPFKGDQEEIRLPAFTKDEVVQNAKLVWNREVLTELRAS